MNRNLLVFLVGCSAFAITVGCARAKAKANADADANAARLATPVATASPDPREVLMTWAPAARSFFALGGAMAPPLVDPGAGVVHAMASEGAPPLGSEAKTLLIALDAQSGKRKWKSSEAAIPLAIAGGKLLALERSRRVSDVVMLDPANGKRIARCAGSRFSVGEGLGSSSDVRGFSHDGQSYLVDQSRGWYAGGAAPSPERERASRTQSKSVHLVTVGDRTCSSSPVEADPFSAPAPTHEGARVLVRQQGPEGPILTLRDAADQRVLAEHQASARTISNVAVSPDGLHLMIQDQQGTGAATTYRTAIRDARTGELVFRHDIPFAISGFAVVGDRLLASGGSLFIAFDLRTGTRVWEHGVPDLRYHGPYPPSPAR